MTKPASQPIRYWNRNKKAVETEAVYGEAAVQWLYGSTTGRALADHFLSGSLPSKVYGAYQNSRLSRGKINPFIHQYKISMDEYVDPGFRSFNDFFIRKFRDGKRPFEQDLSKMPAFCEARYFAFESIDPEQSFPVKGKFLTAQEVLGPKLDSSPFKNGPMLLARLCPTDYHRFHFPDDGKVVDSRVLSGKLHSVNPLALQYRGEILATNERQVSILDTKNFGKLAYVEVGALCVGRIVQTHSGSSFRRGDEKGYFLFGGSTVMVFGEKGRWIPDRDLLEQTFQRRETLVQLGQHIAHLC